MGGGMRARSSGVASWFAAVVVLVAFCMAACALLCGCEAGRQGGALSQETGGDEVLKVIDLNALSTEQADALFVGEVDWKSAADKGLVSGEGFGQRYLIAEAAYLALLNEYLCQECGLDEYQQILDEHPWPYPADEADEALVSNGAFGRDNVLIRNTAYVERLDADDLDALLFNVNDNQLSVTDAMMSLVSRTYRDVLEVRVVGYETPFDVLYRDGVLAPESTRNDALVFVVYYRPDYDAEGNIADREVEDAKAKQATLLKDLMESEVSAKTGVPTTVFVEN